MSELPQGWIDQSLAELVEFNPKHDRGLDRSTEVTFVPMPAVDDKTGTISDLETNRILDEVWKGYTHFQNGDVIFAKITPCMENGKIAVANSLENGLACGSTEFHVLRSQGAVEAKYVWRYLRQRSFRRDAEKSMTGAVGQRRVPRQYLQETRLPVPPFPEQKRIVAKLDALTARSARARKDLARIDTLVTRYKQAVLSKAFSGELTKTPSDQWTEVSIGTVLEDIRYGTSKKCAVDPDLTPVLRIPNVSNGEIDLTDLKHADFDQNETEKLGLRKGDVLVIRSNGSLDLVGRSAVVDTNAEGMLFAGYLIRLRFDQDKLTPMFLHLALQAPDMRRRVEALAKSTSGVNNINSKQIQGLEFRLPPIREQEEIVRRIESAFQKIDRLAAEASRALELTDKLDEAILAKAFRGELVPQDPNDEPASVLLECIKAERAAAAKAKRGRKKAKAS
jgi:type I restriction enzyme, S subunit